MSFSAGLHCRETNVPSLYNLTGTYVECERLPAIQRTIEFDAIFQPTGIVHNHLLAWLRQRALTNDMVVILQTLFGCLILFLSNRDRGFWSAFQSLGINNDRWINFLYGLGLVFAVLLAFGFLFIPVYIYFFVDPVTPAHAMMGGF